MCLKAEVTCKYDHLSTGTSTYITLRMFYLNQITLMEDRLLKISMKYPNQLVRSFSDRQNMR